MMVSHARPDSRISLSIHLAGILLLLLICTDSNAQTDLARTWKTTKVQQLDSRIDQFEAQGRHTKELEAQRNWLIGWRPGEMEAKATRARNDIPRKRVEPELQSAIATQMRLAIKASPEFDAKPSIYSELKTTASEYSEDCAAQQVFLHWMDNDPTRRKGFLAEVGQTTANLARLLKREIRTRPDPKLQLALEFTKYRRARALAYRELPDVVAKHPIENPQKLEQQIQVAFDELINETGPGRTEFILLEIRMLRRADQHGQALELLEQYGNTVLPKWYQKKRRDLLQELGWTIPYQEAAAIFALNFPEYVAKERELKQKIEPPATIHNKSRQTTGKKPPLRKQFSPDKSVVYKSIDGIQLKLDIFLPTAHKEKLETKTPAVVFFFGGGWNGGTTSQFYEQSRYLNDFGIVAFCADYRVRSRHKVTPFECVTDGKSAIRWVRQHAGDFGVDPNRIIAAGGSAGGHVAACTGLIQGLDEPNEDQTISSIPNAMVLFNPVLDTTSKGYGNNRFNKSNETRISPCHQVRTGVVPTLVFHGTADRTVPFENAERFKKNMRAAGNRCELVSFDGAGHGFFNGSVFRPKQKNDQYFRATMGSFIQFLRSLDYVPEPTPPKTPPRQSPSTASKPNIILIYTDDQGYGDVSALNPESKFLTPNMDRIANEGIAFTNGHSADSICTPSRYALLTGRYPWRTRMKRGVLGAEAKCLIEDQRMTIASMLKSKGYHTSMVGKWHLGMDFPGEPGSRDWSKPTKDMPLDKGFDYCYGIPASLNYGTLAWFEGRHAAVPPTQFTAKKPNRRHGDYRIMPPYDPTPEDTKQKLNKRGFEVAPDFVDNQCLTRFTDKALAWMESRLADARSGTPFFLYLPYTSPHFPVCPLPQFHGQGNCGAYGEFLIETDHHIGRILQFLENNGIDDNTLVVFTSDNGPERPWKQHLETFGHDSRGGFRGGKRSVYEGGHRVPFLVRWPSGINSPGRTWSGLVGQVDLLATLAEIVDAPLPENAGEDSHSFAPVLFQPDSNHKRAPLIALGNTGADSRYAIIDGDWKLVMPSKQNPKLELYNLAQERLEQTNVYESNLELARTLTEKLTNIVIAGRSTPGPVQSNDTGYWRDLRWLTEQEYTQRLEQLDTDQR